VIKSKDENNNNEDKISFVCAMSENVFTAKEQIKYFEALNDIEKGLSSLNINRGGKNNHGFVFEYMHAADKNIDNFKNGTGDVLYVINDNGPADFKNISLSGNITYQQAKVGYKGTNKYKILKDEYSDMKKIIDRGNTNLEFIKKHGMDVDTSRISEKDAKNLSKLRHIEVQGRVKLKLSATTPTISKLLDVSKKLNISHTVGINAAKGAMALSAGMTTGKNLYSFINGDMEFKEFMVEIGKDATISSVGAYTSGVATSFIGSNLIASGAGTALGNGASVVIASQAGQMLVQIGSITASFAASLGPAFLVGMSIGIGCTIFQICKESINKVKCEKVMINRFLNNVIDSMEDAQKELKILIDETYLKWDTQIELSFAKMKKAIYNDNFEDISSSIDIILNIFDKEVKFHNMEEFDEFFYSDDVLVF